MPPSLPPATTPPTTPASSPPWAVQAVEVRGLGHTYPSPHGPLRVLDRVDLAVTAATRVAITGPSGSGKSTLLGILGGLEPLQEGTVRVTGTDLARLDGDALAEYRRTTVGFVFQDFALLGALTARENVELAMSITPTSFTRASSPGRRSARRRAALDLLDAVGLADRADHRPGALSGGECQRVAIARALANDPRLILADEPTGNLDAASAEVVLDLLFRLPADRDCTVVVATHNLAVMPRVDDRHELVAGRFRRA